MRLIRIVFVALVALACSVGPSAAQGWFGNLFGGGSPMPRQGAPSYPGYGGGGSGYGNAPRGGGVAPPIDDNYFRPRPRRHVQKKLSPTEDALKEAKAPPKNASLFVYVFGDSLGQMLADGLDDALADRPDVAVVHKAKGSTGLVTVDYYDWPKAVADLLSEANKGKEAGRADAGKADEKSAEKDSANKKADGDAKLAKDGARPPRVDVAVMMIGSNDRQPIRDNGRTLAFGTSEWEAAYAKRVTAVDDTFRAHGVPLIWVGVPITKDDSFADAMASVNDIVKEAASKTGATYIDTWEGFSDGNGDFSSYGPDVNGQTVRLRSSDGIHFTKAGARKLAHFVDAHVRRALDGRTPAPQLPTAEAPAAGGKKPVAAAKPDAGPIRNLNELPDSKNGTLAALPSRDDPGRREGLVATIIERGEAVPIPDGRADSARWPAQGVPDP